MTIVDIVSSDFILQSLILIGSIMGMVVLALLILVGVAFAITEVV